MVDKHNHTGGRRLSRRRVVALAGTGLIGSIAGCSSGGGSDPATTTTESTPTMTESTPTPTTAKPTTTMSAAERLERYGCPTPEEVDITVAKDGSGDYEKVQNAIDSIPAGVPSDPSGSTVLIKPGTYKERLTLPTNKIDVTFVGQDVQNTILTFDNYNGKTYKGEELGTSGSASFFINGQDFTALNLTFRNTSGQISQAVAARTDADRVAFKNCRFIGGQDTLYTYKRGARTWFKDCYIEGDTDFIFGRSSGLFENCEIRSIGQGYIAAPAQPEDSEFGYVFKDCTLSKTDDTSSSSVYLGRPWEPYGQTVYMNTLMDDHIRPIGWNPWDEEVHDDKTKTAYFAEYENTGPGYKPDRRADWSHILSDSEAEEYTRDNVLGDWDPMACEAFQ